MSTTNKLTAADFEMFQQISAQEQALHKRVIDLAYHKINLKREETELEASLEGLMRDRHHMNNVLVKNYGTFTSFNPQTGEYTIQNETVEAPSKAKAPASEQLDEEPTKNS